jgi:hypothetical protein
VKAFSEKKAKERSVNHKEMRSVKKLLSKVRSVKYFSSSKMRSVRKFFKSASSKK